MFGYIVVNQQEMKYKEFDEYHRYYCGLCKSLKNCKGTRGQISLSYDMTFLVMLLTGLYEPEEEKGIRRCVAHPLTKHEFIKNKYSEYAADMNIILTYYKCLDDWQDEKKVFRKLYSGVLMNEKDTSEAGDFYKYEKKIKVISEKLKEINELEKENSDDLDKLSGCFGEVLAEIFAVNSDEWEENLRRVGYHLGRFVYILDAYDDMEKDIKKGSFNPLISRLDGFSGNDPSVISVEEWEKLSVKIKEMLMLAAADSAREFEKLPIIKNVEILRNILYSGIWNSYYRVTAKRLNKEKSK